MLLNGEELFFVDYEYHDSKVIVYAPLRSYLALVSREAAECIRSTSTSEMADALVQRLKSRPCVDMQEMRSSLARCIPELSLSLTDDCSLSCLYCHASAGDPHKRESMSPEMVEAILREYFNRVADASHRKIRVNFHGGGEPTFNFPLLKHAISTANYLAEQIGASCVFSMATNGFYADVVRQFVVENFGQVSLSFDGPPFIHDLHRPARNGGGTFATVYETAKYFQASGLSFAFRATVSTFSLQYIESVIDFFAEHFPNKSLGLEHLNPFGRATMCRDVRVAPPDKKLFTSRLVSLLKYAEGKPIRIVNSASTEYDVLRPVFCTNVGVPNWTVTTSGTVVACARDNAPPEFEFGKYDTKSKHVSLDDVKIRRLRRMTVLDYPECNDCFCKYHCAGDCPDRRLADRLDCGSIRSVGRHVLSRKLLGHEDAEHVNTYSKSMHLEQTV